jgi:isopentenyl-diphosphate delta-isomerase
MDELIDILDDQGNLTGRNCLKSIAHIEGLNHATVHIWFYTPEGNILLQQRAATKKIYPLLWDVSVAGHVNSGESLLTAAIREVKEEIGITVGENDLKKIGVMKSFQSYKSGIIDNEFHTIFISKLNDDIENLSPQKEEVEALKTVSISLFKKLLENSENNSHFVTSNKEYYVFVLKKIKDFIKKNKT